MITNKTVPPTEFRIIERDTTKENWAKGIKVEILSSFSGEEKPGCALGSVEVIDWLGDDLTVVNAARVSFGKEKLVFDDADQRLLGFLQREGHWTPFAQPQLQLRIKMPLFTARQYFKHQIGITRNEVSRRYVKNTPELWQPKYYREAAPNVKQGSTNLIHHENNLFVDTIYHAALDSIQRYEQAIEMGVAPEQARTMLPASIMTEFVETGSIATYMRIVGLRDEATAQFEIQDYGKAISIILERYFPNTYKALLNNK